MESWLDSTQVVGPYIELLLLMQGVQLHAVLITSSVRCTLYLPLICWTISSCSKVSINSITWDWCHGVNSCSRPGPPWRPSIVIILICTQCLIHRYSLKYSQLVIAKQSRQLSRSIDATWINNWLLIINRGSRKVGIVLLILIYCIRNVLELFFDHLYPFWLLLLRPLPLINLHMSIFFLFCQIYIPGTT